MTSQLTSDQAVAPQVPQQTWHNRFCDLWFLFRNLWFIILGSVTGLLTRKSVNSSSASARAPSGSERKTIATDQLLYEGQGHNVEGTCTDALEGNRQRAGSEIPRQEEKSWIERERQENAREREALWRVEERLNRDRIRLELEERRVQTARDRLHEEEERVERKRDQLNREAERIQSMRMGGICLFHGANNVSISGNSSFNIYWGSMGGGAWITFVDAAGRSYPVPEYLTSSYEVTPPYFYILLTD